MAYTTAPTNLFKMHFKDDVGRPASMQVHVASSETDPAAGGCATIASAAAAISDDALVSQELIITGINGAPGSPSDGPYARGADKILMVFGTADGVPLNLQIGAPNEATLAAGNVYVDPSAGSVAALITALKLHATGPDGEAITAFQRGYRRRPPRRKKA